MTSTRAWKMGAVSLTLMACTSTLAPTPLDPRTAGAPTQAAPPAAAPAPQPTLANGKVPGESDAYDIIWTRLASEPVELGQDFTGELFPTRIGLNRDYLYVDLKSVGVSDSPYVGKSEQPRVRMLVDGCPVADPLVLTLLLAYDGAEGRLFVPRRGLPLGDLDLSFSAFGQDYTMMFANDERGLRIITSEERKDVHIIPGDSSKGESDTLVHTHHDCLRGK